MAAGALFRHATNIHTHTKKRNLKTGKCIRKSTKPPLAPLNYFLTNLRRRENRGHFFAAVGMCRFCRAIVGIQTSYNIHELAKYSSATYALYYSYELLPTIFWSWSSGHPGHDWGWDAACLETRESFSPAAAARGRNKKGHEGGTTKDREGPHMSTEEQNRAWRNATRRAKDRNPSSNYQNKATTVPQSITRNRRAQQIKPECHEGVQLIQTGRYT